MIETAMKCPCGTHAVVDINGAGRAEHRWSCHCPRCYDGTEDSSSRSLLVGYGATPEGAIAAWWEQVEQAWQIDYLPNTIIAELSEQAGDEAERQEGWVWTHGDTPLDRISANGKQAWYGPPAEVAP